MSTMAATGRTAMGKTAKQASAKEVRPHLQLVVPLAEVCDGSCAVRDHEGMEALTAMLERDRIALRGPACAREQGGAREREVSQAGW